MPVTDASQPYLEAALSYSSITGGGSDADRTLTVSNPQSGGVDRVTSREVAKGLAGDDLGQRPAIRAVIRRSQGHFEVVDPDQALQERLSVLEGDLRRILRGMGIADDTQFEIAYDGVHKRIRVTGNVEFQSALECAFKRGGGAGGAKTTTTSASQKRSSSPTRATPWPPG